MNKQLYLSYAELERQKDAIEGKQKDLKVQILEELRALPEGKNGVESDFGSFTLQKKTTYAFSKLVADLETKLKKNKDSEIAMGTAKVKGVTEYVVFRPIA